LVAGGGFEPLKIDQDTPLEISTDGQKLIIAPAGKLGKEELSGHFVRHSQPAPPV
jgi:hypothetical protein